MGGASMGRMRRSAGRGRGGIGHERFLLGLFATRVSQMTSLLPFRIARMKQKFYS
jgi:hypothetical protein